MQVQGMLHRLISAPCKAGFVHCSPGITFELVSRISMASIIHKYGRYLVCPLSRDVAGKGVSFDKITAIKHGVVHLWK